MNKFILSSEDHGSRSIMKSTALSPPLSVGSQKVIVGKKMYWTWTRFDWHFEFENMY